MSEISIEAYDSVGSTMDVARELALQGRDEGTVVVASTQTEGRGRSNSEWFSPTGGAWFSVLLKPPIEARQSHRIVVLGGLCACTVIRELCGVSAAIRWPNDLLFGGKKLAGVIGETLRAHDKTYSIVGLGMNTNFDIDALPEELRNEATTTHEILGKDVDNDAIIVAAAALLIHMCPELGSDYGRLLEEWQESSDTIGQMIEVDGRLVGRAVRLDDEGFLIVEDDSGTERRIVSGTVRYAGDPALRKG